MSMTKPTPRTTRNTRAPVVLTALVLASAANNAAASFLSGETLDTAADVLSWIVLVFVPIVAIVVFWLVHVMPEKIAHKRHHPQTKAIQVLCLLSLVFGGMLWPIAWLWAYTRPVAYKLAYGTDRGEEYFEEQAAKARAGELSASELAVFRDELDAMHRRGTLPSELAGVREHIAQLEAPAAATELRRA